MKKLLNHPSIYLLYHSLVGGKRARRICIEKYVRPQSGERVLDVGCGPGFVVDYLPDVKYVGVDIDETYIRYARSRYGDVAEFHCTEIHRGNVSDFGQFDIVMLNGVLHHLDDPGLTDLLNLLQTCLKPSGRLVTLDGCYRETMSPVSRFLIRHDRGQFVRHADGYVELARTVFPAIETHLHSDLFYVPYDLVIMICRQAATSSASGSRSAA